MKLRNKDEALAEDIQLYFIKNNLKEGDRLPTERELSEKYKVQRATVRSAYKILERDGIIEIKERSGRFMGHSRIPTNLDQVSSFSETTQDMGYTLVDKLIAFELFEADASFSQKAKLPEGTMLYKLTRIRSIEREGKLLPIIIEYSYIPEDIAPKIIKHDVEDRSLYDILQKEYDKIPTREEQKVEIIYANETESRLLKVDQMTALILKEGLTYSQNHEVIQYLHAVMNKEWVAFEHKNPRIEQITQEVLNEL